MPELKRAGAGNLHADSDAKASARAMVEFKGFQVPVNRVGYLPQNYGFGVFNLLLRMESTALAAVTAIGTNAWNRPFESGARSDLEVAEASLNRAFRPGYPSASGRI